jgi:hypothetical protein
MTGEGGLRYRSRAVGLKLYYCQPDGHGPLSFYVMAQSAGQAVKAVNEYIRAHSVGDYETDGRKEFSAVDFHAAVEGEVIINANS